MPPAVSSPLRRLLSFLLLLSISSAGAGADELSVVSSPAKLILPPGRPVEGSPGAYPGAALSCNRVLFHGLSRLRNPGKYAHALKVKISVTQGDALFRIQTIELCFHKNESMPLGMCPAGQWQKLFKDSWVQTMSPYKHQILDLRMPPDPSRSIEIFIEEEFRLPGLVFLVLGLIMMLRARTLSESVVFYYGVLMISGIIFVILMILFQLGILLLVCLVLAGAWFGYWDVKNLVLTEEGLVDSSLASFPRSVILIFSVVLILQSSTDIPFAVVALNLAIVSRRSKFFRRRFRQMIKSLHRTRVRSQLPILTAPNWMMGVCSSSTSGFDDRPRRGTSEETKKALRELCSTTDFIRWLFANLDRVSVTPRSHKHRKRRRLFWVV